MLQKAKYKICVTAFTMLLFVFFTFLDTQEIFALSEPNIDRWHFSVSEDGKAINLMDYWPYNANKSEDINIIIPNGYDFYKYFYYKNPDEILAVEKVFIDKELMSKIAKIASQNEINFRISDSDYSDNDFLVFRDDAYGSLHKVFAGPGNWDDCFNFENNNLKDINLSNLDTRYVTSMKGMFANCNNLTKLDLSNFITDQVVDMSNMFDGDNLKLKILDLSSFVFNGDVKTENMFSGVESQSILILASDDNYDRLSELTSDISPLGLKFSLSGEVIFDDETQEKYMFDKAVFSISDGKFWRDRYESFDDYLERLLDIFFKQTESDVKDLEYDANKVYWNSAAEYESIEEKFDGKYSASIKKILVEGQDYKWAQAINELRYNGQEQNLVSGGFIDTDKNDAGVKIEYKLHEEDEWCDEIPTGKNCGNYKIHMRINGGEKYENVEYVDSIGRNYLRVKILNCKLNEGEDYAWPKAANNLKYDGSKHKLTNKGFIKRDKIQDGVKFEYSKDGISWTDNILQESRAGHYKIYMRINGNGKYEDVVYNSNGKKYIEVDIVDNTNPTDKDEDDYDYDFMMANVFGAGYDR